MLRVGQHHGAKRGDQHQHEEFMLLDTLCHHPHAGHDDCHKGSEGQYDGK